MSVITFYGSDKTETAQTTSMASIATYLAVEKDYKILLINTQHNDTSLQECFWDQNRNQRIRTDLETGIDGLIKAISSNKTSPEIITNYTRTVFKDRLEVLTSGNIPKEDYDKQKGFMKSIIKIANKYYDLVFVDLAGSLEDLFVQEVLEVTNLVVANTSQRVKEIKKFREMKKMCPAIKNNNVIILLGRYDNYSKYNVKNLQRSEKIKEIYGIPYNTLLFEACNEGGLADFIINFRKVRPNTVNAPTITAIAEVSQNIIDKLKELQMQV